MAAARTPRVAARSRLGPLPLAASLRLPAFLLTHLLRMKPPITPLPARPTTYEPVTATLELAAALAAPQPRRRNPPPQVVRLHGLPVPSTPTLRPLRLALPTPRIKPRLQPRIPRKRRERKPLPAPRAKLVRVVTPARKGHATALFTQAGFLRASLRECVSVAVSKNTAAGVVFGAHGSDVEVVDVMHLGGWGVTSWVGAVRLSVEYRCALFAPRPVGLAPVPTSAAVACVDHSVLLAVAVSGHA
jgi:hypothetical protein